MFSHKRAIWLKLAKKTFLAKKVSCSSKNKLTVFANLKNLVHLKKLNIITNFVWLSSKLLNKAEKQSVGNAVSISTQNNRRLRKITSSKLDFMCCGILFLSL